MNAKKRPNEHENVWFSRTTATGKRLILQKQKTWECPRLIGASHPRNICILSQQVIKSSLIHRTLHWKCLNIFIKHSQTAQLPFLCPSSSFLLKKLDKFFHTYFLLFFLWGHSKHFRICPQRICLPKQLLTRTQSPLFNKLLKNSYRAFDV